jgi:glutamyl-tRNA reductase
MSLLVVGLNHRTAPTSVLELAAVPAEAAPKVLDDLLHAPHVAEAVVLSTCNRTEVYAEVDTFHGGVADVSDQLTRLSGVDMAELAGHLYVHHEARAVSHLFSVVCGLDSMLVGETQILGQVRAAFRLARDAGGAAGALSALFQAALRLGKRAHSQTGIAAAGASIVSVGVRLAAAGIAGQTGAGTAGPPLAGRRVLVVGAGTVGSLAAATVVRAGAAELVVANRTVERAAKLAQAHGGAVAVGLDDLEREIAAADLVVTSTGSAGLVVAHAAVAGAVAARGGKPLVFLDLALPHDVDPRVAALPGVSLVDLDALRAALDGQPVADDVEAVRALVAGEVAAYGERRRAMRAAPAVVALRAQAAAVVRDELDRLRGRLPDLGPQEWSAVERSVRRVVDKLLHAPTVRVQELAGAPGGDSYAEALRELFDLPRDVPAAVSAPELAERP